MRPLQRTIAAIFLPLVLMALPVQAESLSEGEIKRFAATLPELRELGKEYRETDAFREMGRDIQEAAGKGEFKPMQMMVKRLSDHDMFDEFSGVIAEHGFDKPGEWARTGDRVMRALMAIEMESRNTENMKRRMEAMMDRLEGNPDVSEEQRKRMKKQMESAMTGMQAITSAPEADIEAVRPYRDELKETMEE